MGHIWKDNSWAIKDKKEPKGGAGNAEETLDEKILHQALCIWKNVHMQCYSVVGCISSDCFSFIFSEQLCVKNTTDSNHHVCPCHHQCTGSPSAALNSITWVRRSQRRPHKWGLWNRETSCLADIDRMGDTLKLRQERLDYMLRQNFLIRG